MNKWFPDPEDFDWNFDEEEEGPILKDESKTISWEKAFEENKTRDTCIVCGKPTKAVPLLTGVIHICPCVDKLKTS